MKHKVIFAMIMGVITTGMISFVLLSVNLGYISGFLWIWLKSWTIAYLVAIPTILIVSPKVQLLVNGLLKEESEITKEKQNEKSGRNRAWGNHPAGEFSE